MSFAQKLKQTSIVALHTYGKENHSLQISKAQVKRLANGRKLNDFAEIVDEWSYDQEGDVLHIHL